MTAIFRPLRETCCLPPSSLKQYRVIKSALLRNHLSRRLAQNNTISLVLGFSWLFYNLACAEGNALNLIIPIRLCLWATHAMKNIACMQHNSEWLVYFSVQVKLMLSPFFFIVFYIDLLPNKTQTITRHCQIGLSSKYLSYRLFINQRKTDSFRIRIHAKIVM